MTNKLKRYCILISYAIGIPAGLVAIVVGLSTPVVLTGEGIATMAMLSMYGKAIIGFIISFLIALKKGGENAFENLSKKATLLSASFKYSLVVNTIIWTTFIMTTIIDNWRSIDVTLYIVVPLCLFVLCVAITTFTIGPLICYFIKNKMQNETVEMKNN
jgi:hypothetical protein